ncbi:hypothetical protein T492DRAFT_917629, partial [Pavlovales sp. CCMP2436]
MLLLIPHLIALLEAHANSADPSLICAGLAFDGEDLLRPTRAWALLLRLIHSDDEGVQFYAAAALQNILTDPELARSAKALQVNL